jgi:hypothetical protein
MAEIEAKYFVVIGVRIQGTKYTRFSPRVQLELSERPDIFGKLTINFGVWEVPESIFIEPQGRITYEDIGGIGSVIVGAKLEEAVKGIVAAKEGTGDYQHGQRI